MAQTWTPHRLLRSSEAPRSDRRALVERMEADGYLFLRGALPVAAVDDLRRSVLAVLHEHGFVQDDGVGVWTGKDVAPFGTHPPELHDLRLWQQFVADAEGSAFFAGLFGEPVWWVPIAQYRFTAPAPAGKAIPCGPLAGDAVDHAHAGKRHLVQEDDPLSGFVADRVATEQNHVRARRPLRRPGTKRHRRARSHQAPSRRRPYALVGNYLDARSLSPTWAEAGPDQARSRFACKCLIRPLPRSSWCLGGGVRRERLVLGLAAG